jgi:serine/threonine protein kinase/Tfp pilus assembly protein PilF
VAALASDIRARHGAAWRAATSPSILQIREALATLPAEARETAGSLVLVQLVAEHLECCWEQGEGTELEEYMVELGRDFVEFASLDTVPGELIEAEFLVRHASAYGDHPSLAEYVTRFPGRDDVLRRLRARCRDGERYVLVRLLPPGGLGRVWVAYDRELERYVALKELRPDARDVAEGLIRLAAEARITAQLDHAAIVPIYEVKQQHETFYVMRLVPGRRLDEIIADYHAHSRGTQGRRRILRNQLLQAFITLCDAIGYAHSRNIIHRDLKPHNVVLGEFGQTVVLDWGLAIRLSAPSKSADRARQAPSDGQPPSSTRSQPGASPLTASYSTTGSHLVRGTLAYMAPEQTDGTSDQRSDIFGLGAVLYEILTGQPPHRLRPGDSLGDALDRIRQARYSRPREIRANVPRPLEAVCLRAMALDPAQRYASARTLGLEVSRYLADERVEAYPEGRLEGLRRWTRRHRRLTGGMVTLLLLCVGAGVTWMMGSAAIRATAAAEVYVKEGERLLANGQWSMAQEYFDQALTLAGRRADLYRGRGRAHEGLGQLDRARADFDQAVAVDPQEALNWFYRGTYHARRRDFKQAEADYRESLRLDPRYALTYLNRAQLFAERSQWLEAMADYTQALQLDGQLALAYSGRGQVHEAEGRYPLARADHDRAKQLAPGLARVLYQRGKLLWQLKQWEEAQMDLDEAGRLDPDYADVQVPRPAQFLYQMGNVVAGQARRERP